MLGKARLNHTCFIGCDGLNRFKAKKTKTNQYQINQLQFLMDISRIGAHTFNAYGKYSRLAAFPDSILNQMILSAQHNIS